MATLLTMKNQVLGITGRGGSGSGEKSTEAVLGINFGLEEIGKRHDWKELKTEVDVVLSALQQNVTIASDFQRLVEVRIIDTLVASQESSWVVDVRSKEELVKRFPAPHLMTEGRPRWAYEEAGVLVLVPPAELAWTLRYTYLKKPAELSADGDTADITSVDEALIAYGAYYVFDSIQQYEEAEVQRRKFERLVDDAVKEDGARPAQRVALKPFYPPHRHGNYVGRDPYVFYGDEEYRNG